MLVETKYTFGDIVYLATDPEQFQRIVTRITLSPGGMIYELSCGASSSCHYEMEIVSEKNVLITTSN